MKKINNKGYVLIELIAASIMAFSLGYYLLNLTYEFANKNENLFLSNKMLTYKAVITKTIMEDLEDKKITSITLYNNVIDIYGENNLERKIVFTDNRIGYFKNDCTLIYKKIFDKIEIKKNDNKYYIYDNNSISVDFYNIYIKDDYQIKLLLNSNSNSQISTSNGTGEPEVCTINDEITVTFNPNGGSVTPTKDKYKIGDNYNKLPTPTRNGYTFKGWKLNNDIVTEQSKVPNKNHTLTAVWERNKYTVTFNPNGGTVSPTSREYEENSTYGELPTPVLSNHKFNGWITSKNLLNYNNVRNRSWNIRNPEPYTYIDTEITYKVDENGYIRGSAACYKEDLYSEWNYGNSNWKTTLEAGTYTLSLKFSNAVSCTSCTGSCDDYTYGDGVWIFDKDNNSISNRVGIFNMKHVSFSFTLSKTTDIGIMVKASTGVYRIQLEKGNTATDWEPYKAISSTDAIKNKNHTLTANWEVIDKYNITNLVVDGSFERGENLPFTSQGTLAYTGGSTGYFGYCGIYYEPPSRSVQDDLTFLMPATFYYGHLYYVSFYAMSNVWGYIPPFMPMFIRSEFGFSLDYNYPLVEGGEFSFIWQGWNKKSSTFKIRNVYNASSFESRYSIRHNIVENEDEYFQYYLDGLTLIDLTATFGAGNEPSKEWCDKNLDFFDGSMDIVVQ